MKTKTRDYLFDNYKTILIFLVVVGHFIEPCCGNNGLLSALKWMIVSFHMPAFIFISGYFSKRDLPLNVLFRKLAIPYLAYEVVYYLFYTFIIHKKTGLYLLHPKFSLWYLLALFVWRLITPVVKKIPYHFALSIIAGLMIGCSNMAGNFLSIPRILVFYPFFLAGMYFDREFITKFRNRNNQILAGVGFAGSRYRESVPGLTADSCFLHHHSDACALHLGTNAGYQCADNPGFPGYHSLLIQLHIAAGNAIAACMEGMLIGLGRIQQRLGGNAAFIQAHTAK